jgi:hypothetical protein
VAAKVKEVVVGSHLRDTQYLGEQGAEDLFLW